MATAKKPPSRTPQRLRLHQQLSHDFCMSFMASHGGFDLLDREDGHLIDRLIYVGDEYATKRLALHAKAATTN